MTQRKTAHGEPLQALQLTSTAEDLRARADVFDIPEMLDLAANAQRQEDTAGARFWLEKVAALGDLRGLIGLARIAENDHHLLTVHARWLAAAEDGNIHAIHHVGVQALRAGDHDQARLWLTRLHRTGDTAALVPLGDLALSEGDDDGARHWWRWAASHGSITAMYRLAHLAEDQGDVDTATLWYSKLHTSGESHACYRLGALARGSGDYGTARRWWQSGAAAGDRRAARALWDLAEQHGDTISAEHWKRLLLEDSETCAAPRSRSSGAAIVWRPDVPEAASRPGDSQLELAWLEREARLGSSYALHRLLDTCTDDPVGLALCAELASDSGDPEAMAHVGMMLLSTNGPTAAIPWLEKAAAHGHSGAGCLLGEAELAAGNTDRARRMWTRCAQQGSGPAMRHLGDLARADGFPETARTWYLKSACEDRAAASQKLRELADDYSNSEAFIAVVAAYGSGVEPGWQADEASERHGTRPE